MTRGVITKLGRDSCWQWLRLNSPTSAQTGEIGHIGTDSFLDAKATNTLTEEWFTYFCRINNVSDRNQSRLWQILETIALPKCFVKVRDDRNPIAFGMSVLQEQYYALSAS